MNNIKKSFVENLIDESLNKLGELSVKLAESSANKCCACAGFYETKFPEELIELDEE